ncbi:MAG: glycosyltransferase family 39 protein [bacterium]|nr:glycosyltransferase family 39 protein [bacterium]
MENISQRFWGFITDSPKWKVLLFIFSGAFLLRLPTAFMEFIHIDVITTCIIVKRDILGLAFTPNKGPVYHFLVKWSYLILGESPKSFHFIGIIFILLTLIFIYLLGKKIYSERAGMLGALLYGFIISSYNTEFMATNAEVIYNLFFMAAFYFFYLLVFEKKFLALFPCITALVLAVLVKMQGSWALFAIIAFLVLIKPAFLFSQKAHIKKYYIILCVVTALSALFIYIDWNYTGIILNEFIKDKLTGMINYVANRGFNPLLIFAKLLWRSFHFILYHSIIWIPGVLGILYFFKKNKTPVKTEKETYLIFLTLFLFFSIFLGGARLSVHYFIPVLPLLAIISAKEILNRIDSVRLKKRFFKILIIPVLFFFLWNAKDMYMANFNPGLKHNESTFTFLFRIAMVGSHGEYLFPHKTLLPAIDYLKNETAKDESLFVWPMGSEVVFFSDRVSAIDNYWLNELALHGIVQKEMGNTAEFSRVENDFIDSIKEDNPDYFVDIGSTEMIRKALIYKKKDDPPYYFDINTAPMIRFGSFGGLNNFPGLISFLDKNFTFIGKFGDARIWKKAKL